MADAEVRIGQLRWRVKVARRRQNFDLPGGVSIFEDWIEVQQIQAEIVQSTSEVFYASGGFEQVESPVTHRITTRWLGYIDNTHIIVRETNLWDGQIRGELFRIRRVKELNGRKRFSSLDCELEKVVIGVVPQP